MELFAQESVLAFDVSKSFVHIYVVSVHFDKMHIFVVLGLVPRTFWVSHI